MVNNSQKEKKAIGKALSCLDTWFDAHDKVNTCLGTQYTVNGYQISEIRVFPVSIRISVYVLDRSIQHNDVVRNGDEITFIYNCNTENIKLDEEEKS